MALPAEIKWIFRNRDGLPAQVAAHNLAVTCARYRGDFNNTYRSLQSEMDADPKIQAELCLIAQAAT